MKRYTLLSLLLVVFCTMYCFFAKAQAQALDSTLSIYGDKYQQERIYLHYDKSVYAPAETIWFKAYLMKGIVPAEESKTLYIDWVSDKGVVLQHTTSPIVEGGVTNGQFELPANYNGSFIHVKAYTKWMLNFDTSFLYTKNIQVINKSNTVAPLPAVVASLQFFPEGGDLIAGIKNKVAFKANDQWGRPVRIKGVVQKNGVTIDSLVPIHNGMGYIFLIPDEKANYTARWKDAKGVEHQTNLPAIKPQGISLQLGLGNAKRIFTVSRKEDAPDNLKTLHLVGTMQQTMVFKANANLATNLSVSGAIPVDQLPSGILTVTAFDNNWNAVAERITYINNQEYSFATEMTVQHWGLSKRGRNEIEIKVPENITANLSVSVTDAAIEKDSSDQIISHLFLTGDLKGGVFNPSSYFINNSDSIAQRLDLVMLTHGWRRFKWEDVTKGKLPAITYPKDTTYLTLSGKLFGLSPGQLSSGGSVIMMIKEKDSAVQMVMAPVTSDGSFNNPNFVFFDSLKVYFQPPKSLSGASVRFMTNRLASLNYANRIANTNFPDTSGNYRHAQLADEAAKVSELLRVKTLEAVTVTAKSKSPVQVLDEKYTSGLFKGDGYQFDLVNDPFAQSSQNIFTYLQGKVAGLQISTGSGTPSLQWRGGAPLLYLDEISTEPNMLSSVPITDIAYIKVMRPPFIGLGGGSYGNGGNGAIAIYTRRGGDVQNTPDRGLSSNTVVGYSPVKEFYSPNYGSFVPGNEQRDVRTTLLWKPQVLLAPKKNSALLVFYNNDVTKAFRVVIEGMTKDGQLTHYEELME